MLWLTDVKQETWIVVPTQIKRNKCGVTKEWLTAVKKCKQTVNLNWKRREDLDVEELKPEHPLGASTTKPAKWTFLV